jgi:hypothetical protein
VSLATGYTSFHASRLPSLRRLRIENESDIENFGDKQGILYCGLIFFVWVCCSTLYEKAVPCKLARRCHSEGPRRLGIGMARGDRRESIIGGDKDRRMFTRRLVWLSKRPGELFMVGFS